LGRSSAEHFVWLDQVTRSSSLQMDFFTFANCSACVSFAEKGRSGKAFAMISIAGSRLDKNHKKLKKNPVLFLTFFSSRV
jgi:hypothetical protein